MAHTGVRLEWGPLFDGLQEPAFVVDHRGIIAAMNPAAGKRLGYSRMEVVGLGLAQLTGDDSPADLERVFQRLADPDEVRTLQLKQKSGRTIPCEVSFTPLSRPDSNFEGFLVSVQEIRRRLKTERRSRSILDALVESLGGCVMTIDLHGQVMTWNKVSEECFGYSPEETEGKINLRKLFRNPHDSETLLNRAGEQGSASSELPVYLKDGTERIHRVVANRLISGEAHVGYTCVSFDVTSDRETTKFYETIFQSLNDAIMVADADTQEILEANPQALSIYGYSHDEFRALKVDDVFRGGNSPVPRPEISRALDETGEFRSDQVVHVRRDGTSFPVDLFARRVTVGGRRYSFAVVRDLSKQQKVDELFKVLFEEASNAIYLIDGKTLQFLDVNRKAVQMLGYTREEFLGMRVQEILDPSNLGRLKTVITRLDQLQTIHDDTISHRHKDGTPVPVDISINRVHFGGQTFNVAIARDVRGRRASEKKILEQQRELSEQKEFLELIQEKANDGLCLHDNQGVIVSANPKALEIFRASADQLIGHTLYEFAAVSEVERLRKYVERLMNGEAVRFRSRGQDLRGHEIHLDVSAAPLIRDGRRFGYAAIRDVTLQVRAEQSLRESEMRLRSIIESSVDPVFIKDLELRYTLLNPAALKILNRPESELLHKTDGELIGEEGARVAEEADRKVIAERSPYTYEIQVVFEGILRTFITTKMPHFAHDGSLIGIIGISREITDRKKAEDRLKMLAAIFSNSLEAIAIIDPDGKYMEQNAAHRRLLGYSDADLRGKTPARLVGRKPFARIMEELDRTGHFHGQVPSRTKDRRDLDVELTIFSIRNEAGELICNVGIKRDITERLRAEAAIRESEARYAMLLESHVDGIAVVDGRTRKLTFVNSAMCSWLGYEKKELLGKSALHVHPRSEADVARRHMEDIAGKGRGTVSEMPCRRKDGSVVFADINGVMIEMDGRTCLMGVFRDVTEKRKAHELLRESEERFRSLVHNAPDYILTIDRKGRILWLNRTVRGVRMEDAVGASVYGFLSPEGAKTYKKVVAHVFKTGELTEFEGEAAAEDGTMSWYSMRVSAIKQDDKVVQAIVIGRNMGHQKKTEEKLRKSMEQYAALVEEQNLLLTTTSDFLYRHDADGVFTYMSPAVEQIIGYSVEEMMKHFSTTMTDHPMNEEVFKITEETLQTGKPSAPYLVEAKRKDGVNIILEVNERAYRENGKIAGIVGVARDVTERERSRQQIEQAYEDLKNAQKDLIRAEKLASVGMVMSGIAHEINNPLNVMYGNLRLLRDDNAVLQKRLKTGGVATGRELTKLGQMIGDALTAAENARRVVEEFRHFARDTDHAEPTALKHVIDDAVEDVRNSSGKRIRIVRKTGRLPKVRIFRGPIRRALSNLLKNAVEAIEGSGTITITTRKQKDRALIQVKDSGPGISKANIDRVFDPFFTSKEFGKGFGLGLALCAAVVQNHRGEITVESAPGRGTTFTIALPLS